MTNVTLEKIDLIRERTGASYEQSVELLNKNEGNVVEAIIDFERNHKRVEQYEVSSSKLVDRIRSLIHEGNVRKITIKQNDEIILNIPVNIGLAAVVLAPFIAILAGVAAVATQCTIIVERDPAVRAESQEKNNN